MSTERRERCSRPSTRVGLDKCGKGKAHPRSPIVFTGNVQTAHEPWHDLLCLVRPQIVTNISQRCRSTCNHLGMITFWRLLSRGTFWRRGQNVDYSDALPRTPLSHTQFFHQRLARDTTTRHTTTLARGIHVRLGNLQNRRSVSSGTDVSADGFPLEVPDALLSP